MSKFWDVFLIVVGIIIVAIGFIAYEKVSASPMPFIEKMSLFWIFGLIGSICVAIGFTDITSDPNDSFGSH